MLVVLILESNRFFFFFILFPLPYAGGSLKIVAYFDTVILYKGQHLKYNEGKGGKQRSIKLRALSSRIVVGMPTRRAYPT